MNLPKIAIVYLLFYHNESFVDDVVSALKKISYPKELIEFIVVSNPHPEKGSFVHYIEDTVIPLSGKEIPHTTILAQTENTGFAGGNNIGADWAVENGFEYIFFHNNDGFFAANALEPLVEALQSDEKIGMAQSLMLLHPETELLNSSGNMIQFLGFGFCGDYRVKRSELNLPKVKEVAYASGAALLVRAELYKKYGGWDHDYFLYHEDLEWSMRLRALGYKTVLVSDSIFYHKYQFSRSITKLFWMERNRYGTWLVYFRLPTLLLFLPMALVIELGLILLAIKGKWMSERVKVYKYWLQPSSWKLWVGKRKKIQTLRTVSDRHLLSYTVSGIYFQDKMTDTWLVNKIANPILKVYYWIVVKGLIWW